MVGWHHQLNGCESEQARGGSEGQGSLASCSPWSCEGSDTTWRLNKTMPSIVTMHIYGTQINGINEPICREGMEMQRTALWIQQGKERTEHGERSMDIYTPQCVKQTAGEKLLCNTGSPDRRPVTVWRAGVGRGALGSHLQMLRTNESCLLHHLFFFIQNCSSTGDSKLDLILVLLQFHDTTTDACLFYSFEVSTSPNNLSHMIPPMQSQFI